VPGERLTRRAAMARALGVAAGATGVLAGLGVLLRGAPPARAAKAAAGQRVAASADVAPGAALRIVNPLDGGAAFVVRGADGAVSGLGAVCTHAGCDVEWTGEDFRCPCHHARFDPATGAPTRGPAEMPLPRLEVVERGGEIRVV
jgi:Rieske Fe-S protein